MITLPPETEELARRVATRRGKTPEDVLRDGVELEALIAGIAPNDEFHPRRRTNVARAREIALSIASRPLLDPRTPRDILDQAWGRVDDRPR